VDRAPHREVPVNELVEGPVSLRLGDCLEVLP
jgi:hypothetical protein